MLNSGKKITRFARPKKNILTLVLSERKILNETKNHNPLLQVGRSLSCRIVLHVRPNKYMSL